MIKVSIIVPVYNVSEYIERCWDSIRNQTYKNIEALFVDDCGTDDSVAKLEGCLAVSDAVEARILHHAKNRGLSAARNTGLEAATGDYVYFLDSDDDITEDCIESLVAPLSEKQYDFVVGDYSVVGDGGYSPLSLSTGAVETQEEVLSVASEYRSRGIGLDGIIQDWISWDGAKWGEKTFDKNRYPKPEEMTNKLHDMDGHFMLSIWANPGDTSDDYKELKKAGFNMDGAVYDEKENCFYMRSFLHIVSF